jgi:hypothetical protein
VTPIVQRRMIGMAALVVFAACSFSPLTNRIKVGEEDVVIFVGEGPDGNTDLFASNASGGTPTQLTYTVAVELLPRITSDGGVLAFIRSPDTTGVGGRLVLMNLLNGNERSVALPDGIGTPTALGWSTAQDAIYLRTVNGTWRTAAPPARMTLTAVSGAALASADSALSVWLGEPRFARALQCGSDVCAIGTGGDTMVLGRSASHPLRWGRDSVAWFERNNVIVRGLGPGPARRVTWRKAPRDARDATYARGTARE